MTFAFACAGICFLLKRKVKEDKSSKVQEFGSTELPRCKLAFIRRNLTTFVTGSCHITDVKTRSPNWTLMLLSLVALFPPRLASQPEAPSPAGSPPVVRHQANPSA